MIAITGGGTGGHLTIARVLKNTLNRYGIEPLYIGSTSGQDKNWFEEETGFAQKWFLDSQGVVNKKGIKKFQSLNNILKSSLTCKEIFKNHKVTKVICVGGYSAAPASFATLFSNTKLYIHEQNAAVGKLNKILRPFAKEFFSSYDKKSKVKDYPVDSIFFQNQREIKELKTIIFLGGSQGSKAINNMAIQMAPKLAKNGIKIIHQSGKNEYLKVKKFYKENNIEADVFDFYPNLIEKLKLADFAVSRSGASTLWELTAMGIPSLFIPYPYAAGDHQYYNAKTLSDKNLALLRREDNLNTNQIYEDIIKLKLDKISKGLKTEISPDGAEKIIEIILENKGEKL